MQINSLSPAEINVLEKMCQGLNDDEIAQELFVSPYTVKSHVAVIYQKFYISKNLKTPCKCARTKAVVFAYKNGLMEI